jgi:putative FmdB family regulatory protein
MAPATAGVAGVPKHPDGAHTMLRPTSRRRLAEGGPMPLYEYYCGACNGVFELLRPTREAQKSQPCPECDEDSNRIMSREWAAFVFRDGYPRRIPDDGTFWHLGKKVSQPISGPSDGFTHPELKQPEDIPEPTVEDVERFEVLRDVKREHDLATTGAMHDARMDQAEEGMTKILRRRGSSRVEQEKYRILRKLDEEDTRSRYVVQREQRAAVAGSLKRRRSDGDYVPPTVPDEDQPMDFPPPIKT